MFIYNTLSGKKEDLAIALGGKKHLKMFVCGPTVYDFIHIGNARTYVNYDNFARYLRYLGVKFTYLQNITDIDDKIIARAKEQRIEPATLAKRFEKEYNADEKALRINSVNKYAPATKFIKEIIRQIETLIRKSHAYIIENDGIYFDISSFKDYGKLSKRTSLQAEDSVSRIDESVNKKNRGDFA